MNTAQHTPGPWACDGISEYTGEVLVRCTAEGVNNGDTVARVCCYGPQSETPFAQAANAQLIAAAPDLLKALQEIIRNDPYNQSSAGIIARTAVASFEQVPA